jgi:hypothetical protein
VDPSTSPYVGQLVGTNDVVNDEISIGQDMVVKLHSNGETDLFMMYQKTEGITATAFRYAPSHLKLLMLLK